MVYRKNSGLRKITVLYMNRHILRGEIKNICSDTRCESGENGDPKTFDIGDWVYSNGVSGSRRLLCPDCAYLLNLITDSRHNRITQEETQA